MNQSEKKQIIDDLHSQFAAVQGAVLANFQGLTVRAITEIRRAFRKEGVQFHVVKNTLARIASKDTPLEVIAADFVGPVAIAYSTNDPVAPARVAEEWAKKQEKFEIRCGYVDRSRLDKNGVVQLAKLPGRDVLRASLLNVLSGPASKFVRTLNAVPQQVLLVLTALEKKQKGEG